jgi:hypothetical protein
VRRKTNSGRAWPQAGLHASKQGTGEALAKSRPPSLPFGLLGFPPKSVRDAILSAANCTPKRTHVVHEAKEGVNHAVRLRMEPDPNAWTAKFRKALRLDKLPPAVRKVLVVVVGGALLALGIVMVVTPGPAFVLIPVGLFLLGTEFTWAQKLAKKLADAWSKFRRKSKERKASAV